MWVEGDNRARRPSGAKNLQRGASLLASVYSLCAVGGELNIVKRGLGR